ncbi:methyl-accepting chemotaxis protein [uncultured Aquabacterium sp.]|uniref:methyl-accepting chemotaxis protein n=1 Tax=uncultured Aquabacterium sp. TaxID=158753 RepID=UPI0025F2654B|nr:PAS domain-containing methyl-accepting chemotaxis protein [uncultured Aquabacterium sp.]
MRTNLPVIDQAFAYPKGSSLVSTTDLKGRITYCNPAFVHVSGYSREELLGQPHNMIRHPDMPEEAFRDMWATIENGRPWSGLVKNRRKDGTYYWVRANVTPLMNGDQPMGYMSVRTEPDANAVVAAERLYAQMRAEAQSGHPTVALRNGRVIQLGWRGRLADLTYLDLAGELTLASVLMTALGFGLGMFIEHGIAELGAWRWAIAALFMSAVGLLGRTLLTRLAVVPFRQLLSTANRMAAGDLTVPIQSDRLDIVGQFTRSLNQLQVNLRAIVTDARTEVEQMLVATQEIASGNQDLSGRTEAQASSLEETAASMEEITGTVRTSADTAQQAADLAEQTSGITHQSDQAVDNLTRTIRAIEESSARINDIIQVIDSIAFQTNILALNAAVEAARAGEQGRGFAVVAAEVRALAQRTATAAKEVKQLITDSSEKVRAGAELSDAARHSMREALASVDRVGALVGTISHGAREQLTGISQINEAVSQLDGITQQNAAAVEQIAAASMSMAERAHVLADSVRVFRLDSQDSQHAATDAVALRKAAKAQRAAQAPHNAG